MTEENYKNVIKPVMLTVAGVVLAVMLYNAEAILDIIKREGIFF